MKLNNKGFTLVEVIVAVSILGVITVMALPIINGIQDIISKEKYKTYESGMESAAKLYIDSNSQDEFGNAHEGCIDVSLNKLITKKLTEDIDVKNTTCNFADSFVRVRKSNNTYSYDTKLVCKTKTDNRLLYESNLKDASACSGIDTGGPNITIEPNGNSNYAKTRTATITVSDNNGLYQNQQITYYWKDSSNNIVGSKQLHDYRNKYIEQDTSTTEPTKVSVSVNTPANLNGRYKLVVEPTGLMDAIGNVTENVVANHVISNDFYLDNTAPTITFNPNSNGTNAKQRTVTVTIADPQGCAANQSLKYYWIDAADAKIGSEVTKTIAAAGANQTFNVDTPAGYTGKVRLVIVPTSIKDSIGNQVSGNKTSGEFALDNSGPTVNMTIATKASGYNSRDVRIRVWGSDPSGVSQVCYTATNDVSKCDWKDGSDKTEDYTFGAGNGTGTSYTMYAFAKDSLGNVSGVKTVTYKLYKSCQAGYTYIDCKGEHGRDLAAYPCTRNWGEGWGTKGRRCWTLDKYLHTKCGEVDRTCPCNSQCYWGGVVYPEIAVGGCHKPPICDTEGTLCANNACKDMSYYGR